MIPVGLKDSRHVVMGNGVVEECGQVVRVVVKVGSYTTARLFRVTNLPYHGVILGMKWLEEVNPHIDFKQKTCSFRVRNKLHVFRELVEQDDTPKLDFLLSAQQFKKLVRKGKTKFYLALVKSVEDNIESQLQNPDLDLSFK